MKIKHNERGDREIERERESEKKGTEQKKNLAS